MQSLYIGIIVAFQEFSEKKFFLTSLNCWNKEDQKLFCHKKERG